MTEPLQIAEQDGVHLQWYEEANQVKTFDGLKAFAERLMTEYKHDYGTVGHAMACIALASIKATDNQEQGGVTGFQMNLVLWQFIRNIGIFKSDVPMQLMVYDQLLYPQQMRRFVEVHPQVMLWLQNKAKELLETTKDAAPQVVDHWKMIAAGFLPAPYIKVVAEKIPT